MDLDDIAKDRVANSEVVFKRLLKLCQKIPDEDEKPSVQTVSTEFANYKALLTKLQLQINTAQKEQAYYDQERNESQHQIEQLLTQTENLQAEWNEAQKLRSQRQEYNTVIDDMIRPKKVHVPSSVGAQQTVPIIALLDSTRADCQQEIEQTEQEIEDLQVERQQLQLQWDERRAKFDQVMQTINQFKNDVVEQYSGSVGNTVDSQTADTAGDNEDDDHKMDTS